MKESAVWSVFACAILVVMGSQWVALNQIRDGLAAGQATETRASVEGAHGSNEWGV